MSSTSPVIVGGIGELCTCASEHGEAGVLRNAAIVCEAGVISWVGEESHLPSSLRRNAVRRVDAGGAAVVPGFVDCHTHLVFAGSRAAEYAARTAGASYEGIAAGGGGIRATVAATAAATDADLLRLAEMRAQDAWRTGTTTLEIKTGYGLEPEAELRLLRLIAALRSRVPQELVATVLPLHALPGPTVSREKYVRGMTQLLARAAGQAAFCDVFCDAGAFSPDECRALLLRARELGFGLKLHAEQLAHSGGARLAAELGATSADHLENATPEDMGALAAAEVTGVLLPGAHLSMRGPTPDARAMLRHGMTLALATDCNPGTSHTTDMRLMIALAVGTFGLTPLQALTAATRGAALALGLVDRGSVAPGMRADLLILDADTHVDIAYRLGNVSVKPLVAQFLR